MKEVIAFSLATILAFTIAGCGIAKPVEPTTYSFSGSNEQLTVMNGEIIFDGEEELFHGGELTVSPEYIADVASWSTTFYTMKGDERRVILSNSVIDQTGGSLSVGGDLGRMSGDGILTGSKVEKAADLKDNLWLELKTMDLSGQEQVYQLQLTVVDIT